KLTRRLFALQPDAHYADYHERALFNHIMASIDPEDGRVCYMVPVGRGVQHEYQDMFHGFTCDVGTGMESHALHGDGIYYEDGDKLWVNFYTPSAADWAAARVRLVMDTGFPEGETAKLVLTPTAPRQFTLALRRPYWAGEGFAVKLNGEPLRHGGDEKENVDREAARGRRPRCLCSSPPTGRSPSGSSLWMRPRYASARTVSAGSPMPLSTGGTSSSCRSTGCTAARMRRTGTCSRRASGRPRKPSTRPKP